MKKTNIFLSLALLSVAMTGCFSSGNQSTEDPYTKTDGVLIYSYDGVVKPASTDIAGNVVIPSNYEGFDVTRIPDNAFAGCNKITSITIPNSVSYIGKASFNGCSGIQEITIPYVGLKMDGKRTEGLFGVIFGNKKYEGGIEVTQYCSDNWNDDIFYSLPAGLKKVTVTDTTSLSYGAFSGLTMVEEINLNNNLTTLGSNAFMDCTSLKEMDISNITELPKTLFKNCTSLEYVKLSEQLLTIRDYDFQNCTSLSRINSEVEGTFNLPSSLTSIGTAFNGCIKMQKLITPFAGGVPSGSGSKMNMGYIFDKIDCEGTTSVKQCYGTGIYDFFEWSVPNSLREIIVTNSTMIGYCAFQNFTMLTNLKINKAGFDNSGDRAYENCVEPEWF